MNNKNIILLILLHINSMIIGMENIFDIKDIKKQIVPAILGTKEWWYLEHLIEYPDNVILTCFDPQGKYLATYTSGAELNVFDTITKKNIFCLKPNASVSSISFNAAGTWLITKSYYDNQTRIWDIATQKNLFLIAREDVIEDNYDGYTYDPLEKYYATAIGKKTAYIYDANTQKEVASFSHRHLPISSACFNLKGNRLATGSTGSGHFRRPIIGNARIFTHYDEYTAQQLQLKNAFNMWILIEKPCKGITCQSDSEVKTALLTDIAYKRYMNAEEITDPCKCNMKIKEVNDTFLTFPIAMQSAIINNMVYKIGKYGKYIQQ